MPDGSPPSLVVQLPPGHPEWPAVIDGALASTVKRIAEADLRERRRTRGRHPGRPARRSFEAR